jgi:hypothetical protein
VHVPDKLCSKLSAKSLVCTFVCYTKNRRAYRLVHRPTKHFFESCDVIFDKGGTEKHYEHVILEYNATDVNGSTSEGDPPHTHPTPTNQPESESKEEIEGLLTPIAPSSTPAPATTGRPKRTTCAPTRDDDPRYSITSYSSRKPSAHAKAALEEADP